MTRITAVDLRKNLREILERVHAGEQIVVTYRGGNPVRLVPEQDVKPDMTGLDALLKLTPKSDEFADKGSFGDQYAELLESKYGKYPR